MVLKPLLILLITHGIPMLMFIFMSTDILLRNYRNLGHRLVASLCLVYFLMFLGEFIRNIASIEYSPFISSIWFSSLGLFSLSLAFHYIMHISKLDIKLPKWLNPYIFYLPVIPIILNIITDAQLFSTQNFVKIGMWNSPVYDLNYYMTMIGSVLTNFLIIAPLLVVYKKAQADQKSVYRSLIFMFSLVALVNFILGFLHFPDYFPPYPYLYAGIIFCFYLRKIMQNWEYLQQYDKHYEKLFSMNPDAILLLDSRSKVRALNPVAQAFLTRHQVSLEDLYEYLTPDVQKILSNKETVSNFEFTLHFNNKEYILLLNVGYVTIDLETHMMLIFRNITDLKKQQREIEFLAYHDALTQLPNRRYFFEKLPNMLQNGSKNNETIAIFLLDINNLKMLNDVLGHEAGDRSIKMLGNVLKNVVKHSGIVARVGGDEFMVALNETKSPFTPEQFIDQVKQEFAKKVVVFGDLPIGTSIGYSHYPADSDNIDTLVSLADQSMYEMKKLKAVHYR